jgi:hypothetical protein
VAETPAAAPDGARTRGPGRILVAVYAIFALAAASRAAVQITTKLSEAPLAYLLSAAAAVVYIVATVALARPGPRWRRIALGTVTFELAGVLVVGTLSLFDAAAFPDATVWSVYGRGYLFIPLVLPIIGLTWLRHTSAAPAQRSSTGAAES